jgi:uncharacterized protein YndB with AHSA1/START domain
MKKKLEIEYSLRTSAKFLFKRLSTPAGLAEWFADDVNFKGKICTFIWGNSEQIAELILIKEGKFVRYRWMDSDPKEECFFEFRINREEITGDLALVITDFALDDERKETIDLWDKQVSELKRTLGL